MLCHDVRVINTDIAHRGQQKQNKLAIATWLISKVVVTAKPSKTKVQQGQFQTEACQARSIWGCTDLVQSCDLLPAVAIYYEVQVCQALSVTLYNVTAVFESRVLYDYEDSRDLLCSPTRVTQAFWPRCCSTLLKHSWKPNTKMSTFPFKSLWLSLLVYSILLTAF